MHRILFSTHYFQLWQGQLHVTSSFSSCSSLKCDPSLRQIWTTSISTSCLPVMVLILDAFFCTGAACKNLKLDQYQSICFGLGYPASVSRLNLQLLLRAWLIVPTSISSCIQYLFGTQIPASSGFSATLCCMSSMAVIMIVELHCYVTLFYWERNVCTYDFS